jgi:hypothetical protein
MADYGIFFGWGVIRAGREAALDKVFPEAVAYWDGLKAAGEIEEVRLVMLGAHGGDLSGFALLLGDREKLARLRASPEWTRLTMRAESCLENVGVVDAYVDGGFMRLMNGWGEAVADLV